VYAVIPILQQEGFPVVTLCRVLHVSRSGYYAFQRGELNDRKQADHRLRPQIRAIFCEHRRRYGARRITHELTSRGVDCGTRRVARLMRDMDLRAIQPKSFRLRTTNSRHFLGFSPNLLLEASAPTGINQVWVGDITYVPLRGGAFLYLAMLLDLYSRRIVGWALRGHMKESLVLAALRAAITARQPSSGLLHHTDRGGQYAGIQYRQVLTRAAMRQSMSRSGNCYDNAFMESCFGTVKTELEMSRYDDEIIARKEVSAYIRYYNTRRRHSALGYLTPEAFELALGPTGQIDSH
jgi:putative transposase